MMSHSNPAQLVSPSPEAGACVDKERVALKLGPMPRNKFER
jgi:hypothetical protein